MELRGKAHVFGDHVNTDYIISGKRKRDTLDMDELAKYVMEDLDPSFYKKIAKGDFIVAGENFGCGSSREVAPLVISTSGIKAVLAKSFARIFYRNAINTGLLLVECETEGIENGDLLHIEISKGVVINKTQNVSYQIKQLPKIMLDILDNGGVIEYLKEKTGFHL